MKSNVLFSILFFLISIQFLQAQKAPMKWGKIPTEDLEMTVYEADSQANAVVLGDYGQVNFDYDQEGPIFRYQRHRRIKILTRGGFEEGDIAIPYHQDDRLTAKAQVIQPDGTVTKVDRKEMFNEQVVGNIMQMKIAMPNLTEGCIVEYEYAYSSGYFGTLPTWYFQDDIPTRWSELRVSMLDWFKFVKLFQGQGLLTINEEKNDMLSTRYGSVKGYQSRYVAEKLPALKEETYITTMNDYRAHIKFQLSNIEIPGVYYKRFMTTWEALVKELMEEDDFGGQLNKNRYIKDILTVLESKIAADDSPEKKAAIIYSFVANNIAWNEQYSYYCSRDIDKVYETKEGSSAEINMMLIALLKHYNIETYPVLISTRRHGKTQPIYPFLDQFNHVIGAMVIGDKIEMIDVTAKYYPLGWLPERDLNKNGFLVLNEEEGNWVEIVPKHSKEVLMGKFELDETGTLIGGIQYRQEGYRAINERAYLRNKPKGSFWTDRFEELSIVMNMNNTEYKAVDEIDKPLSGQFDCELRNATQVVDGFIYFSPVVYTNFPSNPFKLEKRDYPIEIPYPISQRTVLTFNIPDGYVLEDIPESINISLPNNGGNYGYNIVNDEAENKIQLVCSLILNQLYYSPEEYGNIKRFFDMIIEKQGEQIVLKKS